jgi:hypothetical protein
MKAAFQTQPGRSRLTRLATTRLLNGGPEVCNRVEGAAVEAIKKAEWNRARKLLNLRLQMRCASTKDERLQIDRHAQALLAPIRCSS